MNLNRAVVTFSAPVVFGFAALSMPTVAQAAPSTFEKALLAELDAPTRAAVEKRVVGGNTVTGVIATTLLNNYESAGARNPGEALDVVAVDFSRGVVVFRRAQNVFEVQRFDSKTLQMAR